MHDLAGATKMDVDNEGLRGLVLTKKYGQPKLEQRIHNYPGKSGYGKLTYDALAKVSGLSINAIRGVRNRTGSDYDTLYRLFDALGLELKNDDYERRQEETSRTILTSSEPKQDTSPHNLLYPTASFSEKRQEIERGIDRKPTERVDHEWLDSKLDVKQGDDVSSVEITPSSSPAVGKLSPSVPSFNPLFTGRQDVLETLHGVLQTKNVIALSGMAGVGKTQTAIAYAHRYRREYNGIYWVGSESVETLQAGLLELAEQLYPPVPVYQEQKSTLQAVKNWFVTHTDWLLILDNADDLRLLAPHFPHHYNGRVLLTTRARNTANVAQNIQIKEFDKEDGATLLLRRANKIQDPETAEVAEPEDREAAKDISLAMGGLPLALNQAGAYIEGTKCSIAEFLRLYRKHGIILADEFADPNHEPVSITYQLATAQIKKIPETGFAATELVSLCAFLSPDAIPEEIFTTGKLVLTGFAEPLLEPDYLRVRAATLAYSLVSRDEQTNTLLIHRLVQEVVKQSMNVDEQREMAHRVICTVDAASPNIEFTSWPLCERLLPHWRLCAAHCHQYSIETAEAAELLNKASLYLIKQAQFGEAESLSKHVLAIFKKLHGKKHPDTATAYNNLAGTIRRQGFYQRSVPLYLRALAIRKKVLPPNDPDMAQSYHNIGHLYTMMGCHHDAESYLQDALKIWKEALGPQHPNVAVTLDVLAKIRLQQGEYLEAETLLEQALGIRGEEHPDTAITLHTLALLYIEQKHYKEAWLLLERGLRMQETHLGLNHPSSAEYLHSMAMVQWKQGEKLKAESNFQQAQQIFETTLGRQHPLTLHFAQVYTKFQEDIR